MARQMVSMADGDALDTKALLQVLTAVKKATFPSGYRRDGPASTGKSRIPSTTL